MRFQMCNIIVYYYDTYDTVFPDKVCGHVMSNITLIGPSTVSALPLGVAAERSVHYIWNYFSLSSFCATYFSSRRGCRRVMKSHKKPEMG
jgi:hypothetical protein